VVLELGTNDAKAVFADRQAEVPQNLEKLIQQLKKRASGEGQRWITGYEAG
jgi:lysophospholipase L1-like esterase